LTIAPSIAGLSFTVAASTCGGGLTTGQSCTRDNPGAAPTVRFSGDASSVTYEHHVNIMALRPPMSFKSPRWTAEGGLISRSSFTMYPGGVPSEKSDNVTHMPSFPSSSTVTISITDSNSRPPLYPKAQNPM